MNLSVLEPLLTEVHEPHEESVFHSVSVDPSTMSIPGTQEILSFWSQAQ